MSHRIFNNPNSIEARQHLLDNRCEHAPKCHRTIGRRKKLNAAKRSKAKHQAAVNLRDRRAMNAAIREYWIGARKEHPAYE